MTRTLAVAACLALAAGPGAAQRLGSLAVHAGVTSSGPGLAARANLMAHLGRVSLGPEAGTAGLGDGAGAWHAGGLLAVTLPGQRVRVHGTAGLAYYSWRQCGDCLRLELLGASLGAGAWFARPARPLALGAGLRWHRQLQRLGAPRDMSFVTAMLGFAIEW